jgi:GAF domain-containing protein
MSQQQKENQQLFDAAVKLAAIFVAKGSSEEDVQLSLLGHTIMTACKAISNKDTAMLLQHHLNEFVDSVRILQKNTTLVEVGLERALKNQN